jgi:hypothetical protein
MKIDNHYEIENETGKITLNCVEIVDLLRNLDYSNSLMLLKERKKEGYFRCLDFTLEPWQDGNGVVITARERD